VKLYLDSRLPTAAAPTGKVELDLRVDASGQLDVRPRSGEASQRADAVGHLARSDPARLVKLGAGQLPCKAALVWFP
jgi:hypothetical protein